VADDVVEVVVQPPTPERFLVTGAYGCIGAWTVRQLVREGVEVIGVDAPLGSSRRTCQIPRGSRTCSPSSRRT
jgi:predicted nuclease with RNAse H fold